MGEDWAEEVEEGCEIIGTWNKRGSKWRRVEFEMEEMRPSKVVWTIKPEDGGKLGCEENSRGSCYRRLNACLGITAHKLVASIFCFLIWSSPHHRLWHSSSHWGWSHWWEDTGLSDSIAGLSLYSDAAPNFTLHHLMIEKLAESTSNGIAWSSLELWCQSYSSPDIATLCYSLLVLELWLWKSGAHYHHMMAVTDITDVVFWTQ